MADSNQMDRLKKLFQYYDNCTMQEIPALYDSWSKEYSQDMDTLNYKVPKMIATLLLEKISGNPDKVLVLDVACGTGKIAQQLFDLGFRRFVGVDGSKGMLEQAAQTALYQELKLAMLGAEPLPAQTDMYDVVVIASALDNFCAPVSVIRELCGATKPGGLVCMARADYAITPESIRYDKEFESERQLMEEEGLWKLLEIKRLDRYMTDLQPNPVSKVLEERNITGTIYLYRKSTN